MLQVKIFWLSLTNVSAAEKKINQWLLENKMTMANVVDIHFNAVTSLTMEGLSVSIWYIKAPADTPEITPAQKTVPVETSGGPIVVQVG